MDLNNFFPEELLKDPSFPILCQKYFNINPGPGDTLGRTSPGGASQVRNGNQS